MFVMEYYGCEGQGIGTNPGAELALIDVISPQPLLDVTFDSNISNLYLNSITKKKAQAK